jgi:hypothetical protein
MTKKGIFRSVLAVLLAAAGLLVADAGPARACSCRAGVPVEELLSENDAAFIGVFVGSDDPLAGGDLVSSARPVLNHFLVERRVKGDIGERVDVTAAASGASCGLELEIGQRTGLLLRAGAGGWSSGLCSQVEPQALLALAPARAGGAGVDGGLIALVGLLVLVVLGAVVLEVVHRRAP